MEEINMTQIMKIEELDCELKYIVVNGESWFDGLLVAQALKYENPSRALRTHIHKNYCKKAHTFGMSNLKSATIRKDSWLICKEGIKELICKSRMLKASTLAKKFDININSQKYECKESESLGAIMKAFLGEKMMTQYTVLNYRLDLYFPDYNLVIECDENGHDDRDPVEERRRQRRVTKKLNCQWLRFNPDSDDFNIFTVINQIFTIIKTNVN
jgi:very-short-patch-repair endonuclease